MYRTDELREIIFQGIPDSLRNELWLIFSGAIYDVSYIKRIILIEIILFIVVYRKQQIRMFIENVYITHQLIKLIMIQ
jgi:hypothetical protein